MRGAGPIVAYRRSGGREPADDERLDIWPDGRFEARRTVAGRRIGRFAGQLEGAVLSDLETKASAAAAAGDVAVPTPMDGATISVLVGGREARVGSNEQLAGPWGALLETLKAILDGAAVTAPVAALELAASTSQASLRHVGDEPLEVDTSSIALRAVRLDAQGLVLGRWQESTSPAQVEDAASSPPPTWAGTAEGWQLELPFRHGLELTTDDWLQVWVTLVFRDGGERRRGRLFMAVPGAGT